MMTIGKMLTAGMRILLTFSVIIPSQVLYLPAIVLILLCSLEIELRSKINALCGLSAVIAELQLTLYNLNLCGISHRGAPYQPSETSELSSLRCLNTMIFQEIYWKLDDWKPMLILLLYKQTVLLQTTHERLENCVVLLGMNHGEQFYTVSLSVRTGCV